MYGGLTVTKVALCFQANTLKMFRDEMKESTTRDVPFVLLEKKTKQS